jgi:uncharacterized Zn-binding protein involved in type VI secretion
MASDQAPDGATDAQPAARVGDEIAHGFGLAGLLTGAVAGALIGAAILVATAATGGLALAIMGGAIAGGGLSVLQIAKGLGAVFNWPEPTTGRLTQGSPNVFINGRAAIRAGDDAASSCTGLALNHPLWPFRVSVAEGSATVFINGKPAARLGSKLVCGARIVTGSDNVLIGGSTISVAFVLDIEGWLKTGLEVLGLAAVGAAAVLAAMVGATALTGLMVAGAVIMGGVALLGDVGDRLGPGYRDLLQGVAGMVLLGVGPKAARLSKPATNPLLEELAATGVKFSPEKIVAIDKDQSGKIIFLEIGDSKSGLRHIVERHGQEFAINGIHENAIPGAVMKALTQGKVVGYQGRGTERPIFEVLINARQQRLAITVSKNGYVVGANPKGSGK